MNWQPRLPSEIEAESFRRIEVQVGPHPPAPRGLVRSAAHDPHQCRPEYSPRPASSRCHRRRG